MTSVSLMRFTESSHAGSAAAEERRRAEAALVVTERRAADRAVFIMGEVLDGFDSVVVVNCTGYI
jgi:hypothetical protein